MRNSMNIAAGVGLKEPRDSHGYGIANNPFDGFQ